MVELVLRVIVLLVPTMVLYTCPRMDQGFFKFGVLVGAAVMFLYMLIGEVFKG